MILQADNTTFDLNVMAGIQTATTFATPWANENLHFCILDYSEEREIDFYFQPLIYIQRHARPLTALRIGRYQLVLPLDWSIMIVEPNSGLVEYIALKDLRDRPFAALIVNPITGYMPDYGEITQVDLYPDTEWSMPCLKYGQFLAMPLVKTNNPPCVFVIKNTNRLPEDIDITRIFT